MIISAQLLTCNCKLCIDQIWSKQCVRLTWILTLTCRSSLLTVQHDERYIEGLQMKQRLLFVNLRCQLPLLHEWFLPTDFMETLAHLNPLPHSCPLNGSHSQKLPSRTLPLIKSGTPSDQRKWYRQILSLVVYFISLKLGTKPSLMPVQGGGLVGLRWLWKSQSPGEEKRSILCGKVMGKQWYGEMDSQFR